MTPPIITPPVWETLPWAPLPRDIPILYEDEEEGDMGESIYHVLADQILHVCLSAHVRETLPGGQVFSNLNLHYLDGPPHPVTGSAPYISPDNMIAVPFQPMPERTDSYKIGKDGPPPLAAFEILSARSAQQRDLKEKLVVYRKLKVPEYFLVDDVGLFLPGRLLLKRLGADGEYHDEVDPDGGVTSQLGFRLVYRPNGLWVRNAITGHWYIRPLEAEQAVRQAEEAREREEEARKKEEEARKKEEEARQREEQARLRAEQELRATQERLHALEEELARLKSQEKTNP